jgi:hypothetical protein
VGDTNWDISFLCPAARDRDQITQLIETISKDKIECDIEEAISQLFSRRFRTIVLKLVASSQPLVTTYNISEVLSAKVAITNAKSIAIKVFFKLLWFLSLSICLFHDYFKNTYTN